jgi:hypothetical protein
LGGATANNCRGMPDHWAPVTRAIAEVANKLHG